MPFNTTDATYDLKDDFGEKLGIRDLRGHECDEEDGLHWSDEEPQSEDCRAQGGPVPLYASRGTNVRLV